ncbi:MAG: hypothetical protein Q9162_007096 [Coniocarpon cinnabarinum]
MATLPLSALTRPASKEMSAYLTPSPLHHRKCLADAAARNPYMACLKEVAEDHARTMRLIDPLCEIPPTDVPEYHGHRLFEDVSDAFPFRSELGRYDDVHNGPAPFRAGIGPFLEIAQCMQQNGWDNHNLTAANVEFESDDGGPVNGTGGHRGAEVPAPSVGKTNKTKTKTQPKTKTKYVKKRKLTETDEGIDGPRKRAPKRKKLPATSQSKKSGTQEQQVENGESKQRIKNQKGDEQPDKSQQSVEQPLKNQAAIGQLIKDHEFIMQPTKTQGLGVQPIESQESSKQPIEIQETIEQPIKTRESEEQATKNEKPDEQPIKSQESVEQPHESDKPLPASATKADNVIVIDD